MPFPFSGPPLGIPFQLNQDSPQARGLIAWWPMLDARAGGLVPEHVNSNHAAQATAANQPVMVADGERGYVPLFDATNDYLTIPRPVLFSTQPFSIAWWEKITSATVYPVRFLLMVSGGTRNYYVFRSSDASANGYAPLTVGQVASVGTGIRSSGGATIASSVGVWRHWVIVCKTNPTTTTATDYTFYSDNASFAGTLSNDIGGSGNAENRIGTDGSSHTDARMDDIRIYNRPLSAYEVQALYLPQTRWELYKPLSEIISYRSPSAIPYIRRVMTALTRASVN